MRNLRTSPVVSVSGYRSMLFSRGKFIPKYRPQARHWSAAAPGRRTERLIQDIRSRHQTLRSLPSAELKHRYQSLKQQVERQPSSLTYTETVCQSFALTTEALRRGREMIYYDVQLAGGLALAAGAIAEIQTGEGKTITTALPAVLQTLSGRSVHVATTNDYLSQRDQAELQPVFAALGLSCRALRPQASPAEKSETYASDVVYGPGYEFGFDFLRDQIALRTRRQNALGQSFIQALHGLPTERAALLQRDYNFAIIDEADSVLIDEATTPLILSGSSSSVATSRQLFAYARQLALELKSDNDFYHDEASRAIRLTHAGWQKAYQAFRRRPAGTLTRPWAQLVEHALRAEYVLEKDSDYVLVDGRVQIVDPNTGRIHDERTWSAGLHQAVETKESVCLTPENETQARVTRQRFQRLYPQLAGLSGTALDGAAEFSEFYSLPVVCIPTHKPSRLRVNALRCFRSREEKLEAIVKDTVQRRKTGQPVLIGTRTIDESQRVSEQLQKIGQSHTVLNGLQDASEANIIAHAGQAGHVTVATNMAGRGTDIRLQPRALDAGGLHVIATEFHSSARVDRQLAGRAARQGDPGSYQQFASADDDLLVRHAPKLVEQMQAATDPRGQCQQDFGSAIRKIQQRVERSQLESRRQMVQQDHWLESIQSSLARRA